MIDDRGEIARRGALLVAASAPQCRPGEPLAAAVNGSLSPSRRCACEFSCAALPQGMFENW